jgi:uncharacterized surface protein with fasciclin (FAS1) repeats
MNNLSKILLVAMTAVMAFATFAPVAPAFAAQPASGNTIVAIAAGNADFSTLVAAVECTGLVPALSRRGQLTVFAPTNEAFAKLRLDASNVCSALPKDTLKSILLYHVARGARYASDVVSSTQIRMLNGEFTHISLSDGNAYINDAQIIATDIPASNGVIHVIDTVLMP